MGKGKHKNMSIVVGRTQHFIYFFFMLNGIGTLKYFIQAVGAGVSKEFVMG